MTEKRVISIDSTILNTFQLCARKAQYNFEEHLQPPTKAEPLERGDLLHKMMELYYGLVFASGDQWVISNDNDTIVKLADAGLITSLNEDFSDWEKRVKFAVEAARYFATKMELGVDEVEETIFNSVRMRSTFSMILGCRSRLKRSAVRRYTKTKKRSSCITSRST